MVSLIAGLLAAQTQIRVACVGDSLTYGYGLPEDTRLKTNYPGVLGFKLGGGYQVRTFGHMGATIMNLDWLPPIMKTDEYKKSLEYRPNIVLIMGGTNDGAPRNWAHVSQFNDDLKALAKSYLTISNHPRVYILIPPRICTKAEKGVLDDEHCNNVNQQLPPMLREFARSMALSVIDTRTAISTRDCYTPDGIHMSEKGCQKLANQVAFVLLKKKTTAK